jgi:hypothetical protein
MQRQFCGKSVSLQELAIRAIDTPQSFSYYHSLNYYDDYDFQGNIFGQPNTILGQVTALRTKGLLTDSAITVLDTRVYAADGELLQCGRQSNPQGPALQKQCSGREQL